MLKEDAWMSFRENWLVFSLHKRETNQTSLLRSTIWFWTKDYRIRMQARYFLAAVGRADYDSERY